MENPDTWNQSVSDEIFVQRASEFIISQNLSGRNYVNYKRLASSVDADVLKTFLRGIIDSISVMDGHICSIIFPFFHLPMMMGQNTPGAAKLLGLSYSSFSDLFGFMGHRMQSLLSLLHMESCAAPTRYGDKPHSLLGMPQGPTRPERTAS